MSEFKRTAAYPFASLEEEEAWEEERAARRYIAWLDERDEDEKWERRQQREAEAIAAIKKGIDPYAQFPPKGQEEEWARAARAAAALLNDPLLDDPEALPVGGEDAPRISDLPPF